MAQKLFRLYIPNIVAVNQSVTLDKKQSHYLKNVLRLKSGDEVLIFNENSGEFIAQVTAETKNEIALTASNLTRSPENLPSLTLCFAPVKNARSEFIIEKATELGVTEIQPIITEHTIVRKVNLEKLQATVIEATEQSERICPPAIHDAVNFDAAIKKFGKTHKFMFCDESGNGLKLGSAFSKLPKAILNSEKWVIFIGPEGGFSQKERAAFAELQQQNPHNIYPVSLGPRILRADTAVITAIALWQNYLGDFN